MKKCAALHLAYKSLLAALAIALTIQAYEVPYFYHAQYLFEGPRVVHDGLCSLEVSIAGGSTSRARNGCNEKVPLFDIFGPNNMQALGVGVPNKDMSNPLDILLTQLALLPAQNTFGQISFEGTFSDLEANFLLTYNLFSGIFVEALIPVRRLKAHANCFTDLSPNDGSCSNKNSPIWQAFLTSFDAILARYDLTRAPYSKTGLSDVTVVFGITKSYEKTDVIDFVDATIRVGFVAPSAPLQDERYIFSVPLGSNKHWGVPIVFDFAFGACEWVIVGLHFDALIFASKTREIRVQTSPAQSGIIRLAKTTAKVSKGTLWRAGGFVRADQFCRGLSCTVGYSFVTQNSDRLCPCDVKCFSPSIINTNEILKSWSMHTLHVLADYEFDYCDEDNGVRLGVFYNVQLSGARTINTNMVGGMLGLSMTVDF